MSQQSAFFRFFQVDVLYKNITNFWRRLNMESILIAANKETHEWLCQIFYMYIPFLFTEEDIKYIEIFDIKAIYLRSE